MRPVLRHAALAAACVAVVALAGCGKHAASDAPITFAPADTPYLFANTARVPEKVTTAWGAASDALTTMRIQQFGQLADAFSQPDPEVAAVLNALEDELGNVHSAQELTRATGFSRSALYAFYGIGDVPVARIELASPETFKAFWARVEKRAGLTAPTATIDQQTYWVIGGTNATLHLLVAIQGKQLVATFVPAKADSTLLKQLLGLARPAKNAVDRLARIDSDHGYGYYGSGYVDLPRLFANLFDGKDPATQAFAQDLGESLASPACASEFASLANQAPLVTLGLKKYTAQEMRGSLDVRLSPALLGALTELKQPVPGMGATSDDSMFDLVLALPMEKWQAFVKGRAEAAAAKAYQCPALQSLNDFARTAANPPVQLPPEAASVLGARVVLDQWNIGPQIAARALVASSNPAALAQQIQQTLPQFALKTIATDGKPVAFDLPPRLQAMLGGGNQGWIAADQHALVLGIGEGAGARLAPALNAPAGNGDTLLRVHFDGKMYPLLASWLSRIAATMPPASQAHVQQQVTAFNLMGKMVESADMDMQLDAMGLHLDSVVKHQ